jgi:hypothetical protein
MRRADGDLGDDALGELVFGQHGQVGPDRRTRAPLVVPKTSASPSDRGAAKALPVSVAGAVTSSDGGSKDRASPDVAAATRCP